MNCFNCGATLQTGQAFCGACGRDVRPQGQQGPDEGARIALANAYNQMLVDIREAAIADRRRHRRRLPYLVPIFIVVVGGGFWLSMVFLDHFVLLFVLTMIAMCCLLIPIGLAFAMLPKRDWLYSSEYLNLPGARAPNRNPRCAWCGGVGVRLLREYANTTNNHICPTCGKTMYVS